MEAHDAVNHPSHYNQGSIECIDAIEAATENLKGIEAVCTGNAIKYLWRWKQKNELEDLRKARWYIDHIINHIETELNKGRCKLCRYYPKCKIRVTHKPCPYYSERDSNDKD